MGDLQDVDAGAAVERRLSRAGGTEDARRRRLQHCAAGCKFGDARHPDVLSGAPGQRELSADREAAAVADRARTTDRLSACAGRRVVGLFVVHAAGRAGVAAGPDHHRDHYRERHAGTKRAGGGTEASDVRDLGGHSRQGRLERDARANWRAVGAADGRSRRLSARHGDTVAAWRRNPHRRRRAPDRGQHRSALGPPDRYSRGDGYRRETYLRHLERAVGRCHGGHRAFEQESGVLRACDNARRCSGSTR